MKLTNEMRNQFLDRVANAMPPVKAFDREVYEARYMALMEEAVPQEVKALEKKFPGSVMRGRQSLSLANGRVRRYFGRYEQDEGYEYLHANPILYRCTTKSESIDALQSEVQAAFAEVLEAEKERYFLLKRLEQVVRACSTDTALRELMPEMAHLIPKAPEKAFPLVATQANNVIADLVKAGLDLKEAA